MDQNQDIAKLLKSYYSVGSILFSVSLTAIIGVVWQIGRYELPIVFDNHIAGIVISGLVTFGTAFVIPEPDGTGAAGRRILTAEEIFTSVIATLLNFAIVLGGITAFQIPCKTSHATHQQAISPATP